MISLNEFGLYLRERSLWTENFISRSCVLGLGILEETITDMHLFNIADRFNQNVITRKFNRREEGSKSGADWLWVVGEKGSWIVLLIQAKVINPKTGNCQHFDYKKGEQRKLLLRFARKNGFIPIYCIYCNLPQEFEPKRHLDVCGRRKEDWACSFLSPQTVRRLSEQGVKDRLSILEYSTPWMDPFIKATENEGSGHSLAKAIEIMGEEENSEVGIDVITTFVHKLNSRDKKPRTNWAGLQTVQAVKKEIPSFILECFFKETPNLSKLPFTGISIISTEQINKI